MAGSDLPLADVVGGGLAFLLTVMTLSYVLGDNPLFRLAAHLFVGAAAGYSGAVAWSGVILPRLLAPLLTGSGIRNPAFAVPLALAALMLLKLSRPLSRYGNPVMAFLVGVGAAVAIGGAVNGTLLPQMRSTFTVFAPGGVGEAGESFAVERFLDGAVILAGTVATLLYFQFGPRPGLAVGLPRTPWTAPLASLGEVFIAITFGAMFAGALTSSVSLLVDRLLFVWQYVGQFFSAGGGAS